VLPCWACDCLDEEGWALDDIFGSDGGGAGGFMRSLVPVLEDSTIGEVPTGWGAPEDGLKVMRGWPELAPVTSLLFWLAWEPRLRLAALLTSLASSSKRSFSSCSARLRARGPTCREVRRGSRSSSSASASVAACRRLVTKELRARVERRDRGYAPDAGAGTGEALGMPFDVLPGIDSSSIMRSSKPLESKAEIMRKPLRDGQNRSHVLSLLTHLYVSLARAL
jgi:hypothetical protein